MEIKNKNILITGGLGSLGSSIATYLREQGANIFIFDCKDSLDDNVYNIDVTSEESVKAGVENLPNIDVLVNCAGEIYSEPILNMMSKSVHSICSWERVISNNLTSTFLVSTFVAQKMISTRTKGIIINFSSISARGNMGQAAYSAAKAGVEALTKVQAKELGMFKIRANAVAPGFIGTPSTNNALSDSMVDYWKKQTPLRKLGTVEDINKTIMFIIENDYLSGTVIDVNGGLSI